MYSILHLKLIVTMYTVPTVFTMLQFCCDSRTTMMQLFILGVPFYERHFQSAFF